MVATKTKTNAEKLKECRNADDFRAYAQDHPQKREVSEDFNGNVHVSGPKGSMGFNANHGRDLPQGERNRIITWFVLIGLGVLLFTILGGWSLLGGAAQTIAAAY